MAARPRWPVPPRPWPPSAVTKAARHRAAPALASRRSTPAWAVACAAAAVRQGLAPLASSRERRVETPVQGPPASARLPSPLSSARPCSTRPAMSVAGPLTARGVLLPRAAPPARVDARPGAARRCSLAPPAEWWERAMRRGLWCRASSMRRRGRAMRVGARLGVAGVCSPGSLLRRPVRPASRPQTALLRLGRGRAEPSAPLPTTARLSAAPARCRHRRVHRRAARREPSTRVPAHAPSMPWTPGLVGSRPFLPPGRSLASSRTARPSSAAVSPCASRVDARRPVSRRRRGLQPCRRVAARERASPPPPRVARPGGRWAPPASPRGRVAVAVAIRGYRSCGGV